MAIQAPFLLLTLQFLEDTRGNVCALRSLSQSPIQCQELTGFQQIIFHKQLKDVIAGWIYACLGFFPQLQSAFLKGKKCHVKGCVCWRWLSFAFLCSSAFNLSFENREPA